MDIDTLTREVNYMVGLKREIKRLQKELDKANNKIEKLVGKKSNARKIRANKEYKAFRLEILERDNNMCQLCGNTDKLQVHHIKEVSNYPELAMNKNNVTTLCLFCHSKTENYLSNKGVD